MADQEPIETLVSRENSAAKDGSAAAKEENPSAPPVSASRTANQAKPPLLIRLRYSRFFHAMVRPGELRRHWPWWLIALLGIGFGSWLILAEKRLDPRFDKSWRIAVEVEPSATADADGGPKKDKAP